VADHEHGEPVTARRGFFWIGVERAGAASGTVARGPMYVQWESPVEVRKPYPIVLVHGGGGQGTDWLGTPDGRPGWATYLLEEGYAVYVVDRPGHGRCSFHPDVLGPMGGPFTFELARALFTASEHPTAHLHTQWLGSGEIGDPALDQFLASSGPMLADFPAAHALEQARCAELLDRIGPAIVMTHSAGGPAGWLLADARPELVRAIVAIEPLGPPFLENPGLGVSLDWGLTAAPLAFDPPVADPAELEGAARRLPNLEGIPIAVVSAEASLLAHSDPATVAFLAQAGCDVEHLRLADRGVHGNGHLMMLERNSREALRPILDWLETNVPARA
jgi:pimeloyl-ACP methyl ester carboxylesterase